MDINSVSSAIAYEKTSVTAKEEKFTADAKGVAYESKEASYTKESAAAVFEKSTATDTKKNNKVPQRDAETIKRLTDDLEQRKAQLRNLVQSMMAKQGKTYNKLSDFWKDVKNGNIQVDPAVVKQAEEDISEDGYWGVKQTSERLVSFAKALAGGDSKYADKMIEAVKKGFSLATKEWGSKLPDICQQTIDSTIEQLEKWRDGVED